MKTRNSIFGGPDRYIDWNEATKIFFGKVGCALLLRMAWCRLVFSSCVNILLPDEEIQDRYQFWITSIMSAQIMLWKKKKRAYYSVMTQDVNMSLIPINLEENWWYLRFGDERKRYGFFLSCRRVFGMDVRTIFECAMPHWRHFVDRKFSTWKIGICFCSLLKY